MFIETCACGNRVRSQSTGDVVACSKCDARIVIGSTSVAMEYTAKFNAWGTLHSYAPDNVSQWNSAIARQWYQDVWKPLIPSCGECRQHWEELTKQYPPDFSSPQAFFKWTWARHDDVSRLHSLRPRISLDQAYALYWPRFNQATAPGHSPDSAL